MSHSLDQSENLAVQMFATAPQRPKFLDRETKAALAESGSAFTACDLRHDRDHEYDGCPNPRWVLTFIIPNSEKTLGLLTFSSNEFRDEQFAAYAEFIKKNGPIPGVRLVLRKLKRGHTTYDLALADEHAEYSRLKGKSESSRAEVAGLQDDDEEVNF